MNADSKSLDGTSERAVGCAFTVANALGAGFLEKAYENTLTHELTKASLMARQQIATSRALRVRPETNAWIH
jgi:GxxExxY protein